ncbi:hypothetical protein R1flu_013579 [Riccia fluitans]|uniref:Uncharacterized protein n=1 Tax=Riccia fluitans TaxID=41844 RepID=A0ABD1YDP2_9MARC
MCMIRRRNNEPYSRKGGCSVWKEVLKKIRRNLFDHCNREKRAERLFGSVSESQASLLLRKQIEVLDRLQEKFEVVLNLQEWWPY